MECFFFCCCFLAVHKKLLRQLLSSPVLGDPSALVRLIHDGQLRVDKIEDYNVDELTTILERCGASISPASPKVQ